MSVPVRLAVFAAALAVAFVASFAIGYQLRTSTPEPIPVHQEHGS